MLELNCFKISVKLDTHWGFKWVLQKFKIPLKIPEKLKSHIKKC